MFAVEGKRRVLGRGRKPVPLNRAVDGRTNSFWWYVQAVMDLVIRVLVYDPGKDGQVREIPDTTEALQALVGGFFEIIFDDDAGIHVFVNDAAAELPVNRRFGRHVVRGPAVFSRSDDQGRTAGLYDKDVALLRRLYG
jgi:hypothetical protein